MTTRVVAILRLSRAHFLIPGIMLYVFGAFFAQAMDAGLDLVRGLFGYAIFGLAHLSVSFSNDYFDREGDRFGKRTPLSGGSGVLQEYPELQSLALWIGVVLTAFSLALGMMFTLIYSFPPSFMLFVVVGNFMAWSYTAPPMRLAYRGWGEISTALAAGFLMPGMGYFVAMGTIDIWFVLISIPLICYGFYFIFTVEMPDVESDRRAGKVNLLVLRGREAGLMGALVVTASGSGLLLLLALIDPFGGGIGLWILTFASLIPLAVATAGALGRPASERRFLGQVRINFASMMIFLLLADLILISDQF